MASSGVASVHAFGCGPNARVRTTLIAVADNNQIFACSWRGAPNSFGLTVVLTDRIVVLAFHLAVGAGLSTAEREKAGAFPLKARRRGRRTPTPC